MAYTQNTDDNGLMVAQAENVAGTGFTNLKANATNSLYVSVQEILATQEQATKGTNAHGAADTTDPPVKIGGHANAAEPLAVDENDAVNAEYDLYGNAKMVGNVAADAADRGCPVKVGGIGNATANTLDEGDRGDLSMDLSSQVRVVADSVTKAADAAFPGAMLAVGFRGNAAKPVAEDEGDIVAPSVDLQGQIRMIVPDAMAAQDAAAPASALFMGGLGNAAAPTAQDEGDILPISTDLQGSQRMIGNLAHDAADAGEPVKIGGIAKAAAPTAVNADLDRVNAWFDRYGRLSVWMDLVMGTAGAAIPTMGLLVQGSDGANARALLTDASGHVQTDALSTPYDATIGAAIPAAGAAIAISDGTNARLLKGDTNGVPFIQGEIAASAADSGNPVKIGAVANAALPSVIHEGDRSALSTDLYSQLRVLKQGRSIELKALAAQTESTNGAAVAGLDPYTHLEVMLNCTVADTDAGDTLDVFIDASPDGGTTWVNIIHFTQIVGTDSAIKFIASVHLAANLTDVDVTADLAAHAAPRSFIGNAIRYRSVIVDAAGDDASFTYSVLAVLKQA